MPEGAERATGIVLAGGESKRFPPNKLAVLVRGEPLFWHALRSVAVASSEVVIVVAHHAPVPQMPYLGIAIHVARDSRPGFGPLIGLAAGLSAAHERTAIVVGGDMPSIPDALLRAMLERFSLGDAEALALVGNQRLRLLPSVLHVAAARRSVDALVAAGERRLHAVLLDLRVDAAPEAWWRAFDQTAGWTADIDRPEDMDRCGGR